MTAWTKTPPERPGFYWTRSANYVLRPSVAEIDFHEGKLHVWEVGGIDRPLPLADYINAEWYPIPIPEPQEGAELLAQLTATEYFMSQSKATFAGELLPLLKRCDGAMCNLRNPYDYTDLRDDIATMIARLEGGK